MRRAARYSIYGLAAAIALVVAAVLVLPQLLDRPRLAAQIQARLSQAVQGEVRWQDFSVRILPAPHGEVRGLRVETAAATLTADEVTVALRLWPLFRGRAEIASLELSRPSLSLTLVPDASVPEEAQLAPAKDPLQAYRSVVSALVEALQAFAPDTVVTVADAGVKVTIEGVPPIEVSQLALRGRTATEGVELDATASSPYWSGMKLAARIRYADLASTAELRLTRLQGKAWLDWLLQAAGMGADLPEVDLDIRFRGDPAKSLEADFAGSAKSLAITRGAQRLAASPITLKARITADASRIALSLDKLAAGATSLGAGSLGYSVKERALDGDVGFHVDLAQALGWGRSFAPQPLERIESASGALRGRVEPAWRGDDWRVALSIEQSDAAVQLRQSPGPIRLASGSVQADAQAVHAQKIAFSLPAGELRVSSVRYGLKDGTAAAGADFDLDLAQTLALVRALLPDVDLSIIESAGGRLRGNAKGEYGGKGWSAGLQIARSDAQVKLKPLPAPLRLTAATIEADPRLVKLAGVAVSLAAGQLRIASARYGMKDGAAAASADFELELGETLKLVRAALPEVDLAVVEAASGRVRGNVNGELAGKAWRGALDIAQSDAQVKLKPLPAPLAVSRAGVRATDKVITVERADVRLLDASASAAATISDLGGDPRIRGSIAEGTLGPKLLAWVWETAKIPASFELKAPVRVAVPQFAWGPKSALEVRADARFDSGPAVAVDLAWSPQALNVRRAHVKDARSDVTVAVRTRGSVIDGTYSGTLDSRTIGAMLKSAAAPAGAVAGELRFVFDREQPQRTTAQGHLKGERVDLSWLAGAPAGIERLELSADGDTLRIAEATVDWAGQRATLRGDVARTPGGPVVTAQVDSPGILVDALMPKSKPPADAKPVEIWPLPVSGTIALRTRHLQYGHYKVEPLSATLKLERERAFLDVSEALVCGLAVPMTVEARPDGYAARALIAAQKQKVEDAVLCLAGEKLVITGPMDLRVDVRTQGRLDELVANLKGTVAADLRNGTVTRFALLGNILSMQNVVALASEGGPNLGADAFPYRQLSAKGRFDKGRFHLDEGVFHSNAIGLGANGWISLTDFQTSMTVLVAPLALVDEAVRKLPLLGYVVGGTFTSLPVAVTGDIRDPRVVPLGPRAITSEMMGLLTRTLSLPGKVVPGAER